MRGSRNKEGNPKNDEFYTPEFIFNALELKYDVDVCAPAGGVPWIPAAKHYSIADDGLVQDWQGLVWCNPPYSNPTPWMQKFINHSNGVALIPVSVGKWFNEVWTNVDAICKIEQKFKFKRVDGQRADIFMPTVLVSMGDKATNALKASGLGRVR